LDALFVNTAWAAALALVGFAANSLLCRAAIGGGAIDPQAFTLIRIVSGAGMLLVLARGRQGRRDWKAAFALAFYAAAFAFAYLRLSAGTGALLLFGSVQLTMIAVALVRGERPTALAWVGYLLALGGLVWLVAPGVHAPPASFAVLMVLAGAAWGVYTLRGRGAADPLADTATNFALAVPLALAATLVPGPRHATWPGVGLAVASGALASGIGYALWYRALPALSRARAATLQLAAPALAALGGVLFLGETPTARLAVAAALVLGGIGIAVSRKG
jgi:drug/metabolite transporter (DMT)-like permease